MIKYGEKNNFLLTLKYMKNDDHMKLNLSFNQNLYENLVSGLVLYNDISNILIKIYKNSNLRWRFFDSFKYIIIYDKSNISDKTKPEKIQYNKFLNRVTNINDFLELLNYSFHTNPIIIENNNSYINFVPSTENNIFEINVDDKQFMKIFYGEFTKLHNKDRREQVNNISIISLGTRNIRSKVRYIKLANGYVIYPRGNIIWKYFDNGVIITLNDYGIDYSLFIPKYMTQYTYGQCLGSPEPSIVVDGIEFMNIIGYYFLTKNNKQNNKQKIEYFNYDDENFLLNMMILAIIVCILIILFRIIV